MSRNALWAAILSALFLQGCATTPPPPATPSPRVEAHPSAQLYEWNPGGLSGETRIVINLSTQRAEITIGGEPAGWAVVATGKEGFATPSGRYTILEKIVDKHSTLYGKTVDADGNTVNSDADVRKHSAPPGGRFLFAPMPYWMRITSKGIGMHAGPIPRPGSPASHGCIRFPAAFAPELFRHVRIGTPVTIVR